MKVYNILSILLILSVLCTIQVSAEDKNLGNYGPGQCISLKQTCANCTFVNITSIIARTNEGATINLGNDLAMTKVNTEYNYTFCATGYIGEYTYNTLGDPNGVYTVQPVTFTIGVNNVILHVIMFILAYGIAFFGFFGRNEWLSIIGGLCLLSLGIFTIRNGIADYRIFITNVISITTIAVGAFISLLAGVELIRDALDS